MSKKKPPALTEAEKETILGGAGRAATSQTHLSTDGNDLRECLLAWNELKAKADSYEIDHPTICYKCGVAFEPAWASPAKIAELREEWMKASETVAAGLGKKLTIAVEALKKIAFECHTKGDTENTYCFVSDTAQEALAAINEKGTSLDPHGCHKQVALWLEAGKYRKLLHRHDDTFVAADEAENKWMHSDTLPLLADALMNWPQGATAIEKGTK